MYFEFENMIKLILFVTLPMIHNKFKTEKVSEKVFGVPRKFR